MYNLADTKYKTQIFTENGAWTKPEGCVMVMVELAGAGGGGGGGSPTSATFIGGGAGGSGGFAKTLIPAIFLPNDLYIIIGKGGAGGASNLNGIDGGNSGISLSPNLINGFDSFICYASGGGNGGRGPGGGAGGAVGTPAGISSWRLGYLGIGQTSTVGQAGTNGGSSAVAVDFTISASTGNFYSATGGGGRTVSAGFKGGNIIGIDGIIKAIIKYELEEYNRAVKAEERAFVGERAFKT
jgi:hypothetical protein